MVSPQVGTGLAVAVVHHPVVAELGGEATGAAPLGGQPLAQHVVQRLDQRVALVLRERAQRGERGQPGPVQGGRRRSPVRPRPPCAGRAARCGPGAGRRWCAASRPPRRTAVPGPGPASGPSSPSASTHQPALRSEPNSFTSTDGRSTTAMRTTPFFGRVVLGGSPTSTRPPWDRCTSTRGPARSTTRNLPRRPTPTTVRRRRVSGAGAKVFSPAKDSAVSWATSPPASTASRRSARPCISGSSGTAPTTPARPWPRPGARPARRGPPRPRPAARGAGPAPPAGPPRPGSRPTATCSGPTAGEPSSVTAPLW